MKINYYSFELCKDLKSKTIFVVVRYKNEPAVEIPLLDIILALEKI